MRMLRINQSVVCAYWKYDTRPIKKSDDVLLCAICSNAIAIMDEFSDLLTSEKPLSPRDKIKEHYFRKHEGVIASIYLLGMHVDYAPSSYKKFLYEHHGEKIINIEEQK